MNIMVIGAGAIGQQRIKVLQELNENIIAIIDPVKQDSDVWHKNLTSYFSNPNHECIDWFFICTPHNETCNYVNFALNYGANVLAEKPIGRDIKEYKSLPMWLAKETGCKVYTGFNYRFFKGVNQLLIDEANLKFGSIISVNMVLGVGSTPPPPGSWRNDHEKEGRGAILDPGIHLIDLALLISNGTLTPLASRHWDGFWNTGIEEETHIIATDENDVIYNIQASKVKWRTTFRIEVNGTDGYGIVEGRNKHYGNQTYVKGARWAWQSGRPQRKTEKAVVDYDGEDSFLEETKAVLYGTNNIIQPATYIDNYNCLKFIDKL